jgi:hypothetical protein
LTSRGAPWFIDRMETAQKKGIPGVNGHAKWQGDWFQLSDDDLREVVDLNARKLLGISGDDFLRLRREKRPLKKPAWSAVDMLACLLE